jgi:hypothetical protein
MEYEGSTNGMLVVSPAIPTVTTWPTGTVLTVGQALSASTLSNGSASVPGNFSFNVPGTVPPVGVYTAVVTFAAMDSTNYANVAGSVAITVNPPLPSMPTLLTATPSLGQVSLTWAAVAGATSYNVKRAPVTGGPYTTLGSTAVTNYLDNTVSNGTTYFYVVSALNAGGEGGNSAEASAGVPHVLPFVETFESRTLGNLNGQNGWTVFDAVVQTATAKGTKAASITSEAGYVEHRFAGAATLAWTDFVYMPVFSDQVPSGIDPEGTAVFYFNTSGHAVVYNGQTPQTLTHEPITQGQWVRVTIKTDYATKKWELYVNGTLIGTGFDFYNQAATAHIGLKVVGAGTTSVALDDLTIGLLPPWSAVNRGTMILFHF